MIKKIFSILMNFPAIGNLFKSATTTGRIDPFEAVGALSTISPSAKQCVDTTINTVNRGGNVSDAASAVMNLGEIDVSSISGNKGQTINTKTVTKDLKNIGEPDSVLRKFGTGLANLLESLPNQAPENIVELGNAATDINNWKDIIKQ